MMTKQQELDVLKLMQSVFDDATFRNESMDVYDIIEVLEARIKALEYEE